MSPADVFFGSLLSFLIGVLAVSAGWNVAAVFFSAVIIGIFLVRFKKCSPRYFALFFIVLFFGAFYYHLYLNLNEVRENIPYGKQSEFFGVIASEPKFTEKTQYFNLRLDPPLSGTVTVFTDRIPEYSYGARLLAGGVVERSEDNRLPTVFYPRVTSATENTSSLRGFSLIKAKLVGFKLLLIGQFRKVLPSDSAALLSGLTFGFQSDFSKDFKEQMSLSGTTHLVALSGYNIAILVFFVAQMLQGFLSRRKTFYATVIIIFLFVVMVGAEASVVRAAIMGFLVLFAREAGRFYSFRNAITLAAAVMVVVNPTILVFDLGFQLSFVSLLGIVYAAPAIKNFFGRFGKRTPVAHGRTIESESFLGWRENLTTTFAAQLAVAPFILMYFGQVSLTSLLANILILEFVPITMILGFLLAAITFFSASLGLLFAGLLNVLLSYEIGVIKFFSFFRLPVAGSYSWFLFLVYYLLLIAFIARFSDDKKRDVLDKKQ